MGVSVNVRFAPEAASRNRITMPAFHSEAAIARQIGYVRKVPEGDLVLMVGSAQTHAPKL